MQARGPLMMEHRLIEWMIAVVRTAVRQIESGDRVDPSFIDTVVDFIRTYAERTRHGKEEDILCRELDRKSISGDGRRRMPERVDEHVFGRETTKKLVEANRRYRQGGSRVFRLGPKIFSE